MTNVTNLDSLKVAGFSMTKTSQAMTANGAINITNGVVTLNKAGVLAATLAAPTDVTDDHKELVVVSLSAQAHTVTHTPGFSGAGAGKDVATFGGAVGDSITLVAFNGAWHVKALNGVTVA